jgi:NADH-quinone oxidoreductase subunit N
MNFYNFFINQFTILIPELYLFIFINILLLYGVIYNTSQYYNYPNLVKNIGYLSLQIILITFFLIINNNFAFFLIFNKILLHSNFTTFFKLFILILSFLCFFISFNYLKNEKINTFEYHILLLIVVLGSLFLISANYFLTLYLSIEIISLSLYILSSYKTNSSLSTEAGLKYVILGSFSSGLFLFGVSLIYGFTGTINFTDLSIIFFDDTNTYYAIILGLIFFLISFLFKLGAAPFHMWVADIYEGIPMSVTIFLTTVPKVAILSVLIRICYSIFYHLIEYWQPLLSFSAIISIVFITFVLVTQKKIKRFLAYSSIVHIGYLLLGISLGTTYGIQASVLYLMIYMINTINIWTILISIDYIKKTNKIKYISDLNFLYKTNPILAFTLTLSLFSMAGIPPLAGFFAKFYIFLAALENASYFLLFVGILTSIISTFYYIRIIKVVYFESKQQHFYYSQLNYKNAIILSLSTLIIVFFIFFLKFFLILSKTIALNLFFSEYFNSYIILKDFLITLGINL